MSERGRVLVKRLLVLPPLLAGAALLAWQLAGREPPVQEAPSEVARPVRVITVAPGDYVPRALGFGVVEPGKVWNAVADVPGRIVWRHPNLEPGRILTAGTEILRIDPTDYELAVARIEANLDSVDAQIAELETREANIAALVRIERRALELANEDLERRRTLLARGNASQASVDQAETAVLAQRQKVQDLENQQALLPAQRRVLEADHALRRAELREARLDLERTSIRLPFDARVTSVEVEVQEHVTANQRLAVADSIDVAEISAQLAFEQIRPLIGTDVDLKALDITDFSVAPRRLGLSAEVRLRIGDIVARWDARFDRIAATIDPRTRTAGFFVAVDDPYGKVIPGKRPPLVKNMYVEVELSAPARPDTIVVPRVALRQHVGEAVVPLAGPDDRLVLRPVTPGFVQGDFVVVESGLAAGDRVVVSDLVPAIEGMLLDPSEDEALAKALRAEAAGRTTLR